MSPLEIRTVLGTRKSYMKRSSIYSSLDMLRWTPENTFELSFWPIVLHKY